METCSEYSPLSRVGMPQAYSTTSRPRMTSPLASETTLPCSSATSSDSSSRCRSMRSRSANMTRARRMSETSRHSCHALLAAATAASTSAGSASATWACSAPVAGFQTVPNRVDAPVVSEPAIQCWIVRCDSTLLELLLTGTVADRAWPPRRPRGPAACSPARRSPTRARPTSSARTGRGRAGRSRRRRPWSGPTPWPARARPVNSLTVLVRSTSAPRLAAFAARSTGRTPPSSSPVAGLR